VIGWGDNTAGQATGVPTENPPNISNSSTGLVLITGLPLTNAVAISAGRSHSLALRKDGTVAAWGGNFGGAAVGSETPSPHRANGPVRLGGAQLSNVVAISAGGNFSLALQGDGTVVAWGWGMGEAHGRGLEVPPGLTNVVQIAAGWNYNLALTRDGTVIEWGDRKPPAGLSNIVAISTGGGFYAPSLALKGDGTVIEWRGANGDQDPTPAGLSNLVAVAAGAGHCLALRRDGVVVGWGDNNWGQATGVPNPVLPHRSEGTVVLAGQPLSGVVAIAAGCDYSLAVRRDGTVVAWGGGFSHVTNVPTGLSNVVAVAAGENFCLTLTTNGARWVHENR
jgi:alpha-tubulin suppressor-like RCC1 family protein